MTELDIYKSEHLAIADLFLCDTPDGQEKQQLHYIDGLNTIAAMIIDAMRQEEKLDRK